MKDKKYKMKRPDKLTFYAEIDEIDEIPNDLYQNNLLFIGGTRDKQRLSMLW